MFWIARDRKTNKGNGHVCICISQQLYGKERKIKKKTDWQSKDEQVCTQPRILCSLSNHPTVCAVSIHNPTMPLCPRSQPTNRKPETYSVSSWPDQNYWRTMNSKYRFWGCILQLTIVLTDWTNPNFIFLHPSSLIKPCSAFVSAVEHEGGGTSIHPHSRTK